MDNATKAALVRDLIDLMMKHGVHQIAGDVKFLDEKGKVLYSLTSLDWEGWLTPPESEP